MGIMNAGWEILILSSIITIKADNKEIWFAFIQKLTVSWQWQ